MNADEIKTEINNVRHYSVESLRALAGVASEIRGVKDAEARKELTQLFELVHARKVAVWSRIPKRFPEVMSDNGRTMTTDAFLSVAYLCQLPEETCQGLYAAHYDHLNEPNVLPLIRNEVNAAKPQRAPKANSSGHAASDELNKARQALLHLQYRAHSANGGCDLCLLVNEQVKLALNDERRAESKAAK